MQVAGHHGSSLLLLMATGGWVSNAYPTCRMHGNSPWKRGLMPDGPSCPHGYVGKGEIRHALGMRSISLQAG